jgi:hypothetical protein
MYIMNDYYFGGISEIITLIISKLRNKLILLQNVACYTQQQLIVARSRANN